MSTGMSTLHTPLGKISIDISAQLLQQKIPIFLMSELSPTLWLDLLFQMKACCMIQSP